MKEALAMEQDSNQEDDTVEVSWRFLKHALMEAEGWLPDLPSILVQNWASKELTNLSGKKSKSWMHLCKAKTNNLNLPELQW